MRYAPATTAWLALTLLTSALGAQPATGDARIVVAVDDLECLPIADNNIVWTTVRNHPADSSVRLYFRRMNDVVEDFYYVEMHPDGGGRYWGALPKAEDRPFERHDLEEQRRDEQRREEQRRYAWAGWWKVKEASDDRDPNRDLDDGMIRERASLGKSEPRHWMLEMDDAAFEQWLEAQQNEPAEYFVAVYDPQGTRLGRSRTKVVPVRDDCRIALTPQQRGEADNLTVGETAPWQGDEEVFHWLCDGVVSRLDPVGVLRSDGVCRACVIAWWKRPGILVPAALGAAAVTGVILLNRDERPPASPSRP